MAGGLVLEVLRRVDPPVEPKAFVDAAARLLESEQEGVPPPLRARTKRGEDWLWVEFDFFLLITQRPSEVVLTKLVGGWPMRLEVRATTESEEGTAGALVTHWQLYDILSRVAAMPEAERLVDIALKRVLEEAGGK